MRQQPILYGGDYNPEQWLDRPDILAEDLTMMKKAGINTVTLGVFAWASLEPTEGEYHFDWLEGMVDTLWQNGISVIMATPSGARPKWLSDAYPEVLRVQPDGTRNQFGGRHNHCLTSPVYRQKVAALDAGLAKRFGRHPAVRLWHISNEFSGECHCPLCRQAFRGWLQKRYGTIEKLNAAWWTKFWSHTYQSFDQVESPSPRGEQLLHGLTLDWKRFVTDETADFIACETAALRANGATQPTTINLMFDFTGLDYSRLAQTVDVISWDSYPVWHEGDNLATARENALQHDWMRSLKRQPFLLMESCPTSTNWQKVSKLKRPGLLAAAGLQAVAHGSDSILYFQIRQSRGASEKFHGAVIDHYGGEDTRVFREVAALGRALPPLAELTGTETRPKVALLYDVQNRWAMESAQGPRNSGLHYYDTVLKIYQALRGCGVDVDIVNETQTLDGYRLVFAPMLYLYRCGIEQKLRTCVQNGATLAMTYWSGVVDENDLCFLGAAPHALTDLLGLRRTEIDGLFDGQTNRLCPVTPGAPCYTCANLCELVELTTAQPRMVYGADFYKGQPALTENQFGKGTAWYLCADAEQAFYDVWCRQLLENAGVTLPVKGPLPDGVAVSSRENAEFTYRFVQNFGDAPADISSLGLAGTLLYGADLSTLPPYGTVIVRQAARPEIPRSSAEPGQLC